MLVYGYDYAGGAMIGQLLAGGEPQIRFTFLVCGSRIFPRFAYPNGSSRKLDFCEVASYNDGRSFPCLTSNFSPRQTTVFDANPPIQIPVAIKSRSGNSHREGSTW